ncbi:MAG: hypothetical protein ONB12_09220 [candidate division KSB1 bacterium]|nr:hypothetical protein [candidate division KSB1 bacterium]
MKKSRIVILLFASGLWLTCSQSTEPKASPPQIAVVQETIVLTGTPRYDALKIYNAGGGALTWTITEWPNWLTISSYSGSIAADTLSLRLTTDFTKLPAYGDYEGAIKITSNGGELTVTVKYTYRPPQLKIDTPSLNFDRHFRYTELVIQNAGGGELRWQITEFPEWLQVNAVSGSVYGRPENVPLRVRLKDLPYGSYQSRIRITSNAGEAEIVVFLTYEREVEVYPGVGMAGISLGDTYIMVQNKLGQPDRNWYDRPEKTVFIHHFTYDEMGLHFAVKTNSMILFGSGKVGFIEVHAPYDGLTPEGIGIGSTAAELTAAYGEPTARVGNEWRYPGITYIVQNNTVINMIMKSEEF